MPTQVTAVVCRQCKKLHNVAGKYIVIEKAVVRQKLPDDAHESQKRKAESVVVEDVIVCNNECLSSLFQLAQNHE